MGGKDSKPEEAAGGEPPAHAAPPAPKPASPKAAPAKPAPEPAPAAKAVPAGPIGDPSAMKLVVPANDPAALKCLIAASAGGVAVYQVAGEVRVNSRDAIHRRSRRSVPSTRARLDRVSPKSAKAPPPSITVFSISAMGARVSAPPDPSPSSHLPRPPHRPSPRRSRRASPSALPARSATVRPHATRRRVPSVRYRRLSFSPRQRTSQRAKDFSRKTRKTAQSRVRARDFSSDALSSTHRSLLFLHPNKKTQKLEPCDAM